MDRFFVNKIQITLLPIVLAVFIGCIAINDYRLALCVAILFMALITIRNEDVNVETRKKCIKVIVYIIVIALIIKFSSYYWRKIVLMEVKNPIRVNMNNIFRNIPFNNPNSYIINNKISFWITRTVYTYGFILPVIILILRQLVKYDFKGAVKVLLCGQLGQIIFILPFYLVFNVQEVWYVCKYGDYLKRTVTPYGAYIMSLNCFPSMHTSVASSMILLALKEKNKIFKWIFIFYNICIIYSTLYLRIHWTIDVIAGMLFAFVVVKLFDALVDRVYERKDYKYIVEDIEV